MFDIYKNTEQSSSDADVVKVTIPRELRGSSEILVFLSPQPISGESTTTAQRRRLVLFVVATLLSFLFVCLFVLRDALSVRFSLPSRSE